MLAQKSIGRNQFLVFVHFLSYLSNFHIQWVCNLSPTIYILDQMNKTFLRAINDVKKQKEKQDKKKTGGQQKSEEEVSSAQEKHLKEMGVQKKKIQKDHERQQRKWRHDRYKQQPKVVPKPPSQLRQLCIRFDNSPGYSKIYPIVKHIKIYIRQIDDSKIVFNTPEAFEQAKKLFGKSEFTFVASETQETST